MRVKIDSYVPTVSIDTKPQPVSTSSSAHFELSGTSGQSGKTFECSLNDAAFSTCSSPKDYSNLPDGVYTFRVRVVSGAGSMSNTASYTWTVQNDATPPTTTAQLSPHPNANGWNNTDLVSVTLKATDDTDGTGVKQVTYHMSGAQNAMPFTELGDTANVFIWANGTTTVSFQATDNAETWSR